LITGGRIGLVSARPWWPLTVRQRPSRRPYAVTRQCISLALCLLETSRTHVTHTNTESPRPRWPSHLVSGGHYVGCLSACVTWGWGYL